MSGKDPCWFLYQFQCLIELNESFFIHLRDVFPSESVLYPFFGFLNPAGTFGLLSSLVQFGLFSSSKPPFSLISNVRYRISLV
jgi:hypothetical protein